MKICKGAKFVRKRISVLQSGDEDIYLGQIVIITDVQSGDIHFKRKLLNGQWDLDCSLKILEFSERFKLVNTALENK